MKGNEKTRPNRNGRGSPKLRLRTFLSPASARLRVYEVRSVPAIPFDNTKKYGEYSGLDEDEGDTKNELKADDYIAVQVTGCSTGTLFGTCLGRTTLMAFQALHGSQRLPPKNTVAAGAR